MSASTSKGKKVRYESGTKGSSSSSSSHHHRSSRDDRDSGVGSSSASDRASLGTGTAHNSSSFKASEISSQRHNLRAVQEALDAANDKIKQYETENANLNFMLSESNKENRLLKKEKTDLHNRVEELLDDREDEKKKQSEKPRRGSSERKSPPRTSPRNSRDIEAAAPASYERESARRSTGYQQAQMYPAVPQAPANLAAPNPFLPSPRYSSAGVQSVIFSPERVAMAAASSSYATPSVASYSSVPREAYTHAPAQPRSRHGTSGSSVHDGRYHLSPL